MILAILALIATIGVLVVIAELAGKYSRVGLAADGMAGILSFLALLVIFNAVVSWAISRVF